MFEDNYNPRLWRIIASKFIEDDTSKRIAHYKLMIKRKYHTDFFKDLLCSTKD